MTLGREIQSEKAPAAYGTDEREARSKFWIAAYTRSNCERKAAAALSRMGIETYVPLQSVIRQWSDRKKRVDLVVIPNIIFVYIHEADMSIIQRYPLITRFLSFPGKKTPAHIPENQINNLKFVLKESDIPVEFKQSDFKVLDSVRVIRGKLKGVEGYVENISEQKSRLRININLLGGVLVDIPTSDIERINS